MMILLVILILVVFIALSLVDGPMEQLLSLGIILKSIVIFSIFDREIIEVNDMTFVMVLIITFISFVSLYIKNASNND